MNLFTMKPEKMLQLRSLPSPCGAASGKTEAGGELSSRPTWAAGQVRSQPGQLSRVVFKKERRGPRVQPGMTEAIGAHSPIPQKKRWGRGGVSMKWRWETEEEHYTDAHESIPLKPTRKLPLPPADSAIHTEYIVPLGPQLALY